MSFGKENLSDHYLQVTCYIFSNQICFITGKIKKIQLNFVLWEVKSNKFICICVLTGKIQQIDLNFCFDMKIQTNLFEFVFWQRKSIWSIFTGHLLSFFKSNLLFDRKSLENWVEFCVLTGKIKYIHLHLCCDRKNPANDLQFFWTLCFNKRNQSDQYIQVTFYISPNKICFLTGKTGKINSFASLVWKEKSCK